MNFGIILAGGVGKRFGNSPMPKQFLSLGTKPVIIHTIEQFLMCPAFDGVVVGCPKIWIAHMKDIVHEYIGKTDMLHIIQGGQTRQETIMEGCRFIQEHFSCEDDAIVVTHDAVRPFITQRILMENIEGAQKYGAVDTVVCATDTIVKSLDGAFIEEIPVRGQYYQGQTPQSFQMHKLMALYASLSETEKQTLTDACKIFVLKGEKVKIVTGDVANMKITTPHDLKVANALLTVMQDD